MKGVKRALTKKQENVYNFIRGMIVGRGYGPTVREICDEFGWQSPTAARCHVLALEKKGFITREAHSARSIQLTQNPTDQLVELNEQLLKDWRSGHIKVSTKASKAKAGRISDTFKALRSQIGAIN